MAVTFDTLKAATRLREQADSSEKQAAALVETFADGIVENLATREDLAKTEQGLRADLDRNTASLRNEMHKLEHRMTLRLGTVMAAGVAVIVAFDKLF